MVYVHVPFCKSFCTYSGFYSELCRDLVQVQDYVNAVCQEAKRRAGEIVASQAVNTLYIGGGTPSVLSLAALDRIVKAVRSTLPDDKPFEEFTLEVNPEDVVDRGPFFVSGLLALGVDRVSMGVQSFDDVILRWMNRRHSAEEAEEAYGMLRRNGVQNISIDLIFGLPLLTDARWEATLDRAVALGPEHISAYQLSVEPDSALERQLRQGVFTEASEEQCRRQYDRLCQKLAAAGYHHYEVSNFANPGFEARHNAAYWQRVPYVGLGPGAHSLVALTKDGVPRVRRWNPESLSGGLPGEERLSEEEVREETLMLGLRTDKGLPADRVRSLTRPEALARLLSEGALVEKDAVIRIPENHFFVSDEIIRELL